ncbi:MAG: hypothetical protein H7Z39_00770 [Burkholderiaceae bacterium]|nr:hypothetical protein [Burkholderiaceae bacterium]
MTFAHPPRQPGARAGSGAGFTLLMTLVLACVVGLLLAKVLERIGFMQEQAELVAAQRTLVSLRTALNMKVAELTVTNRRGELAELARENPMDWLVNKPGNYAGEYFSLGNDEIPPGNWYFDRKEGKLVYLLRRSKFFHNDKRIALKFRVSSWYLDKTNASSTIHGVSLDQVNE